MAKQLKADIVLGGKLDGSLLKSMSTAEKRMAALRKHAGTIHNAAGVAVRAAGVAAAAAGAATIKIVKDSVEAGKNFDASMAQVAATMGKSVDEIGDLRKFALDMGKSTMFSASQSADALNYMALAGYDAETAMKMLPNVLNLAAAGGMELADASDMVTDASSALGLNLDETAALVDKMAKASSKSNTSVSQLGEALLVVGGTAKNMKGGTTEMTQALGLLADNGIKGAEGGTALRNVLLGLSSDKFQKTFGELGVSAYDAHGNMRSLEDIFLDMNAAMADMTVEEKTAALSSAFNKVDLKSLNALLGTSKDRWEELAGAIDDSAGAAQKMAETQMDNLAGDITRFESAMEGAQIALSDALTPALREFVQYGTEELGNLTDVFESDSFKQFAGDFAKGVTDAMRSGLEAMNEFKDGFAEGFDAQGFMDAVNGVGAAVGRALGDGSEASTAKNFGGALAGGLNLAADAIVAATPLIEGVAGAAKFLADNASVVVPIVAGIAGAFVVIDAVSGIAGVITTIGTALGIVGGAGTAAGAGLAATAGGEAAAGAAAAGSVGQMLALGGAVLMIGGGVALAALGLGLMAQGAIALASAGAPAIGMMFGMVGALFAVGAAAYFAGPAFTVAAPGLLAFGAAALMVGAGIGIASAGISLLAAQLPLIATYGMMAGPALMLMGTGLLIMGAGGMVAGAGLLLCTPALLAFSAAAVPGAAAVGALGAAVGLAAGPIVDMGNAMGTAGWGMQAMAEHGMAAGSSLSTLASASVAANPAIEAAAPAFSQLGTAAQDAGSGLSAAAAASTMLLFAVTGIAAGANSSASGFTAMSTGMTLASATSAAAGAGLTALAAATMAAGGEVSAASAQMSAAFMALPGAAASGTAAFASFAAGVRSGMSSARTAVSSACSSMQSAVSGMNLTIPTPRVASLPHFSMSGSFDPKSGAVPSVSVSYYARGGFTDGPIAIAGEAGTEAVISFDPRYRDQNVGYWLAAGQMLGVIAPFAEGGFTDGTASAVSIDIASPTGALAAAAGDSGGSGSASIDVGGITFAPQIRVSGGDSQDVMAQLRTARDEFADWFFELIDDMEADYAPVF